MQREIILALLSDSRTYLSRYCRYLSYLLQNKMEEGIKLINSGKILPEADALPSEQKTLLFSRLSLEIDAMKFALSVGISYESAFNQLFPHFSPYPSEQIWTVKYENSLKIGVSYNYDDLMLALLKQQVTCKQLQKKFVADLGLYRAYLSLMTQEKIVCP